MGIIVSYIAVAWNWSFCIHKYAWCMSYFQCWDM